MSSSQKERKELALFHSLVNKITSALRKEEAEKKEIDRLQHIYADVYHHAKLKGQTHDESVKYCFNVYKRQAPDNLKDVVIDIHAKDDKVRKTRKSKLREMIRSIITEGDVIDLAPYLPKSLPANLPEDGLSSLIEDFYNQLSDINIPTTHEHANFAQYLLEIMDNYFIGDQENNDFEYDDSDSSRKFVNRKQDEENLD